MYMILMVCVSVCTCRSQRKGLDVLYHSLICSFETESLTKPRAHDFDLGWQVANLSDLPVSVPLNGLIPSLYGSSEIQTWESMQAQ